MRPDAIGFSLGAVLVAAASSCMEASPPPEAASVPIPVASVAPVAEAQVSPATSAAAVAERPPLECPPDMVRILGAAKMPAGLAPFCLDKTEVTVEAYRRCVDRGACTAPSAKANNSDDPPADAKWSSFCNGPRNDRARHPINCVTHAQATTFCKEIGRRLPTGEEWSFAANGGAHLKYPWGDEPPSAARLNACDTQCMALLRTLGPRWVSHQKSHAWSDGFGATAPVGSFVAGASKDGVLDLAGNVSEWISGPPCGGPRVRAGSRCPVPGTTLTQGSGWNDAEEMISRTAGRSPSAEMTSPTIGFRCAFGEEDRSAPKR